MMKINCSLKLGIVQAVLQTFNAKFQNKKLLSQFIAIKVFFLTCLYVQSLEGHINMNVFTTITNFKPPDATDFSMVDVIISWVVSFSIKSTYNFIALTLRPIYAATKFT